MRTDPPHRLLFNRQWWVDRWQRQGWNDTTIRVAHTYDNHSFEMSECQLILSKGELDIGLIKRIATKNIKAASDLMKALTRRPLPGFEVHLNDIRDN
ncbi:hypothetical protein [Bradyrhizobium sp. USDA 4502]